MVIAIIQMNIFLLFSILAFHVSQSSLQLPTDSFSQFSTQLNIASKQVPLNIDLAKNDIRICCKENESIFQIAYNFLSNPFFQVHQFTCPSDSPKFVTDSIKLETLGLIPETFQMVQYPLCSKSILGLSKKSTFLSSLPTNFQIFYISVNKVQGTNFKKFNLQFGDAPDNKLDFISKATIPSPAETIWDLTATSITLGSLDIGQNEKFVFATNTGFMKVPSKVYDNLIVILPSNQNCVLREDVIYCPCESGIPPDFPNFFFWLNKKFKIQLTAKKILEQDSARCELKVRRSQQKLWQVDIALFENMIFKFDKFNNEIEITKEVDPVKQNSSLIQMPIQLILNSVVILVLCVFIALIIIEIIKRVSGLEEVIEQSFREYMIRRNME